jgi:hypothetical protein
MPSAHKIASATITTSNVANGAITTALVTASGVQAYRSTTQSVPGSTITAILFDSELYDSDGYHSTSSNTSRITVPTAGKYSLKSTIGFSSNGTGVRYVFFCVNGSTGNRHGANTVPGSGGSLDTIVTATADIMLNASDYVEVYVFQSSGGALNVLADSTFPGGTRFSCMRWGS